MMYNIKNLTNSPYKFGTIEIPARGEIKADLSNSELASLRSVGYFSISEVEKEKKGRKSSSKATE